MTVTTETLRPLLVSFSEQAGGAARASQRLYSGLRASGIDAHMLVQSKSSRDPNIIGPTGKVARGMAALRPTLDQLPLFFTRKPIDQFMTGWLPDRIEHMADQVGVNIINLHEIRKGNLRIESLGRLTQPIVWTLHDLWALTGGCHYDAGCGRYKNRCGNCPLLAGERERDLSRRVMQRKENAWQETNLTVVAPSHWIANCARQSTLLASLRIEVIPNGLDITTYRPLAQRQARDWLGLPQERNLLLFLAVNAMSDRRKGFAQLQEALLRLRADSECGSIELMVVGASARDAETEQPFPTHYLGHLHDDVALALAYSAADIFVAPSLQDNLPNTVMEALACGTPALAFDIGGMPDMIDHQVNGYLAEPRDAASLAGGIRWLLTDRDRLLQLGSAARKAVETRFTVELQVERYSALYVELINNSVRMREK